MAFTGLVALATTETVTAVMVFTAIAEVGVAMTVMGMVTGDKNLTKTGAMVSMVGGLGGMAAGSGALSSAAGETAAGQAASTGAGEVAASTAAEEASKAAIADTATDSAGNIFAGAPTDAAASSSMPSVAVEGANGGLASTAPTTMPVGTATETMPVGASETATSGVSAPTGVTDVGSKFDPLKSAAMDDGTTAGINQAISTGGKTDSNSFFSGVGKVWDGLGPEGKGAAIKMVGGAFSGAAETERHNDMMDYRNRDLALRSHGSAVARYNKGGIINSAKA